MIDISEAEARALLAEPTHCVFDCDWVQEKSQPGTFYISAGLMDRGGVSTELFIKLYFRRSLKTRTVNYLFSVFRRTRIGQERVYQLDVLQSSRPIKSLHDRSHQHIGSLRQLGASEWDQWQFEDVLEYFCSKTNISMSPGPGHPEHLGRSGQL